MVEAFSTNDIYYVRAINENSPTDDEKTYKTNVDKLNLLKETYKLTERQNGDFNTSQNALILNNVTLGIGIFAMMWIVYNK
jgi:outer membrane protein assembly factor BamE (lipoprotein component of BamABCDE complex)